MEVDLSNPNISVMPGQKNISEDVDYTDTSNWGTQIVRDHATHAEENLGLNVVGAMNVSLTWSFTHPYGLLIYKGKVLYDDRAKSPGGGYLAVTKDGKAELREPKAELTGDEWMAQTICFHWLVKDGKSLYATEDHASEGASRSVIGIKADGTLVLMMNDGRQSPYSAGFTNHEMAETMLALGCVDAINCDGGGSSTFMTEREGTGDLSLKCRPSDGSERQTLSSILVISEAEADGKFDHATLEAEDTFVTPGASVKVNATGADKSGGPADVPEDISWQLKDASMGTVKDGVFTSNGTVGQAVVQMVYDGAVVGEDTINVVVPDTIKFAQNTITAPYGKTVDLQVIAMYGVSEVVLQDDDISYELSDLALGTVSGNKFTACDASTGLTKYGEDYYYVRANGEIVVNKAFYAYETLCDLPAKEYYNYGADGKMLQGIAEGKLYINGQLAPTGLTKYGEDYYYVRANGEIVVNKAFYAYETHCNLPKGQYYYFDTEGVLCEGICAGTSGVYYYEKGQRVFAGLIKVDGDFYYVGTDGKCATNQIVVVRKSNCELPVAREYAFGADGKMVQFDEKGNANF